MAWLKTRWPFVAIVHCLVGAVVQRQEWMMLIARAFMGFATSANVIISDRYHNGDRYGHNLEREIFWLRHDFFGISAVLTSTFCVWALHIHLPPPFALLCNISVASTMTLLALAWLIYERDANGLTNYPAGQLEGPRTLLGVSLIKLIMAVQFFGLFGFMVYSYHDTPCAPHTVIWYAYLPGIILYALQWPADGPTIGAHDIFHAFVVLGHVLSMVCDVINLYWKCAGG